MKNLFDKPTLGKSLSGFSSVLAMLIVATNLPAHAQTPISLTGYNADIVTDADKTTRFAQPLDIGTAAYFQAGAVDDGGTAHANGLPTGSFSSDYLNTATGGHTVFGLQSPNAQNALLLRYNPANATANVGALTLTTPGRYTSLAILAAGYNASPTDLGTVVLSFADGSQSGPLSYNAFDWGFGASSEALTGLGRNFDVGANGKAFNYNEPVPFSVFETDINLTALGLDTQALTGLTFTGGTVSDQPGVPNHGPSTSILAVSGSAPVPEASTALSFGLMTIGLSGVFLAMRKKKFPGRLIRRIPGKVKGLL